MGECVRFQPRMVPLYPKLIKFHSNIMIGAGIPARKIGSFDDFVAKRRVGDYAKVVRNQRITEEEIKDAWVHFHNGRE